MAVKTTNYQCPACTAPLRFDGASGKLVCDYCESSYTVQEIEALFAQQNEKAAQNLAAEEKQAEQKAQAKQARQRAAQAAADGWDASGAAEWGSDGDALNAYNCTSCGAELICDANTAATECPYCGNPTIIPGKFSGALKPEFVIPFKLDKNAAVAALRRHYGGKKLLPRVFADENHIQKVQGVYVPFWLYSGTADADAWFETRSIHTFTTKTERITETSIYEHERSGNVRFEKIPVDASSKMDDALMDSIEPYDYADLKPFSMSYLPGFLADKYDVSAADCAQRADLRAANAAVAMLGRSVIGEGSVSEKRRSVRLNRGKAHYALMPVWILTTKWGDKNYLFAMNGQTGKLVGDLPMDKSLYWKYHLIWCGALTAALFVVQTAIEFLL